MRKYKLAGTGAGRGGTTFDNLALGKMTFFKAAPDERRRILRELTVVLVIGLCSAGVAAGMILMLYNSRHLLQ